MIQLVNYSDYSVALFGTGRNFWDDLSGLNGKHNKHLKLNGEITPGWIFSKKQLNAIEAFVGTIKEMPVQTTKEQTKALTMAELTYKYRLLDGLSKYRLALQYMQEIHAMQEVNSIESAIANVIGYVSKESFNMFGDRNQAGGAIAKTYFRKDGKSIDLVAMEAESLLGMEITPDNVVDYILKFPFGWPTCRTEKMKLINECYQEVYGKQMNRSVAKLIVDTYNEMKAEVSRNEVNNDIF